MHQFHKFIIQSLLVSCWFTSNLNLYCFYFSDKWELIINFNFFYFGDKWELIIGSFCFYPGVTDMAEL